MAKNKGVKYDTTIEQRVRNNLLTKKSLEDEEWGPSHALTGLPQSAINAVLNIKLPFTLESSVKSATHLGREYQEAKKYFEESDLSMLASLGVLPKHIFGSNKKYEFILVGLKDSNNKKILDYKLLFPISNKNLVSGVLLRASDYSEAMKKLIEIGFYYRMVTGRTTLLGY